MEWILGTLLLLCGVGLAVALPLAWKEESVSRRQGAEAQSRAETLQKELAQLNTQLQEANRLNAALEQEKETGGREVKRLSDHLSEVKAKGQHLEARVAELEKQLVAERERHRAELAAAQKGPDREGRQTPPSSPEGLSPSS